MAGSALTVFELEADGFTHLSCFCEGCRHTVLLPIPRLRHRAGFMVAPMTLAELRPKLRCQRCPDRRPPDSVQPWRQSDHGYTLLSAHRGNHVPHESNRTI